MNKHGIYSHTIRSHFLKEITIEVDVHTEQQRADYGKRVAKTIARINDTIIPLKKTRIDYVLDPYDDISSMLLITFSSAATTSSDSERCPSEVEPRVQVPTKRASPSS